MLNIDAVERLLGVTVHDIERVGNGKNSRLFKVVLENGTRFAAKTYLGNRIDGQNRAQAEYSALRFLWDNKERQIPKPVKVDLENNIGIYEFINGRKICGNGAELDNIDQLIRFLSRLKALAGAGEGEGIGPASEACFSPKDIASNIESRLRRLKDSSDNVILAKFLGTDFIPVFEDIAGWMEATLPGGPIPLCERTLSPSDFGFHNALKLEDGRVVFVDFEYFGWDDPAKLISDFLLHPAMTLNDITKQTFLTEAVKLFGSNNKFQTRLKVVYPMYALKWVMILLNEYVPAHLERLGLGSDKSKIEELQAMQMDKAKAMLGTAVNSRQNFPYEI